MMLSSQDDFIYKPILAQQYILEVLLNHIS